MNCSKKIMRNVMSWIKLFGTNFIVFCSLIVIVECGYFLYDNFFRERVRCEPEWVLYNYCPNITAQRINHEADGGLLINIEVDENGSRVPLGGKSNLNSANRILIGDSFIQADEMNYSDTLYGRFNTEQPGSTYALGYSSWNPIQYLSAIKRVGQKNSNYYVFLMTNDVSPRFSRSVYREARTQQLKLYLSKSFAFKAYKALSPIKRQLVSQLTENTDQNEVRSISLKNNFDINSVDQCHALDRFIGTNYAQELGFDYLVFAKAYTCWPQKHKEAYGEFSSAVRALERYVTNDLSSTVNFVWVTAGWAFSNQNSIGRMNSIYRFDPNERITQQGLTRRFIKDFPDAKVVDTELLISDKLAQCNNGCSNEFFYSVDGHWTPRTHNLLFEYIRNEYNH